MTLRGSVVETLALWNATDEFKATKNDFMFIQFLLIDIFGGDKLANREIDPTKLEFVKEVFSFRANDDQDRLSIFEEHVTTITQQFGAKNETD